MTLGVPDVTGPSSSVIDDIATFADTTGKLIKDSGKTISQVIADAVAAALAAVPAAGIPFSGCRLVRSGALSVAQNTVTPIPWDVETWDTDGYHDSTHPTRVTIPAAGKYRFHAQLMDSAHAQDAYTQLRLMKNGSEVAHGGRFMYGVGTGGSVGVVSPFKTDVFADLDLSAGDIIEVEAYAANNGINQSMVLNVASSAYCFVVGQRLS